MKDLILFPKNIYGLSKKMNEEYVEIHSNKKIKYIGLRFFTVFGEWGRPDMLILKFLDFAKKKKTFYLIMQVIIGEILLILMM